MRLSVPTRLLSLDAEPAELYTRFRITGECNPEDLHRMLPVMLEEATRHGFQRTYIDLSAMVGELQDFARYALAESLVKHWGVRHRVAIECSPEKHQKGRLFETVALNRFGLVRVGDQANELLMWLLAD